MIQLFDQKRWKKDKNQGFLGVINVPLNTLIGMKEFISGHDEMLKVELKKSNSNEVVSGSIDLRISPGDGSTAEINGQLQELGLSPAGPSGSGGNFPSSSRRGSRKSTNPSASSNPSSSSGNALSSTEDQLGPLPPGYVSC